MSAATSDLLLDPGVADDDFVRRVLEEVELRHDLEDVFLIDTDGIRLFALRGEASYADDVLRADPAPLARALTGAASASGTIEIGGVVAKAGYAPVEDWDGVVEGVLVVTAGGGFFGTLPGLRRTFAAVTLGSAALVILLGVIFFGMSRRLAATESALARNETLTSMGIMAAGVAHEIRNPLAIIAGTAERLKRRYGGARDPAEDPAKGSVAGSASDSANRDPLFDFIPEEVERLNGIVESYLRFARDEPPVLVGCDLAKVVERSARMIGEQVAPHGVTIETQGVREPLPFRADPQRIQQVMLNLLLNAAQAMPAGGRIGAELSRASGSVTIAVSDDGSGFDERALALAFEPFYTTKEQGSGLGLVMVKRIVEAHGGGVVVANRPGGGAIVTVTLPAGSAQASGED